MKCSLMDTSDGGRASPRAVLGVLKDRLVRSLAPPHPWASESPLASERGRPRPRVVLACVLVLAAMFLFVPRGLAQGITTSEYFWDVDPGPGLGTSVQVTSGETVNSGFPGTHVFNVDVSGLAVGLHKLGVRVQEASGRWSDVNWMPLQVHDESTIAGGNSGAPLNESSYLLVSGEYFWDTDPGQGAGTAVTFPEGESFKAGPPGTNGFNADVSGLAVGLHVLGVRTKDASGRWGSVNWLPVQVHDASSLAGGGSGAPLNESSYLLVSGEYFWDTDPGQGSGTAVTFPPSESFNAGPPGTNSISADVFGLAIGLHALGVRTRDASGRWSGVSWLTVQVHDPANPTGGDGPKDDAKRLLVAAEYYWDVDPGAGNGTALAVEAATSLRFGWPGTNEFRADFSAMTAGAHNLGMRVREAGGAWSPIEWSGVAIPGTPLARLNGVPYPDNVVQTTNGARFEATLETRFADGMIFYTTDGSDPNNGEPYFGPFTVTAPFSVRAIAMSADFTEVNEMDPIHTLTTSTPGGGTLTISAAADPLSGIATASLRATPNTNWTFLSWTGDASGNSTNTLIVMDRPKTIEANFGTTLNVVVTGTGSVSRLPNQNTYPYGTVIRFSAIPDPGHYFRFWGGAAAGQFLSLITLVLTNGRPTVSALFGPLPANTFALTLLIEGEGSVTRSPIQSNYVNGATVTLTPTPAPAHHFLNWSGDAAGSAVPLLVSMTASKTVTARFESDTELNAPPATSLRIPSEGAVFTAPVPITLTADASDPDPTGTISQVAFFAGETFLGVANAIPYTLVWSNAPVGNHTLTCVATDNRGATTTSAPVHITVNRAPNQPPRITLLAPLATDLFRDPTNILMVAEATDEDGTVASVDFFGNGLLVGTATVRGAGDTFSFTWTNAPVGVNTILARAADNEGATTPGPSRDITVLAPEATTFRWAQASRTVSENAGTLILTILKTGVEAADVSYLTKASSAKAGRDFGDSGGVVHFAAGQPAETVSITLFNNYVPDAERQFEVELIGPSQGALGTPSVITVTLADDDASLETSSFLDFGIPTDRPALRGRLQVYLEPPEAEGQWRFPWELAWRPSGGVASDLDPGDYLLEFRPRASYTAPDPNLAAESIPLGASIVRTNRYEFDASRTGGSLRVTISPVELAPLAGWRFVGDTAYHVSGEQVDNVPAGIQVIEFRPVPDWVRPAAREVLIQAETEASLHVSYLVDAPPILGVATPIPLANYAAIRNGQADTPRQPFALTGQLRSVAGYGSGIAVRDKVVLTAAHVLFDETTLDFVPSVDWFGARHAGEYEPHPISARGWYVHTNYLTARRHERNDLGKPPGVSTPASQQWDVAAIYFEEPVARGGFSGYLLSDDTNEWLLSSRQKELLGYPLSGTAEGRMHQVLPGNFTFTRVEGRVFSTDGFLSYPGNSGGPLCVRSIRTDGQDLFFPAAVYLGNSENRSLARAIDRDVASLINRAASSAALGLNFDGGGVIGLNAGAGFGAIRLAKLTVQISPPEAIAAGAGWRLQGSTDYRTNGASIPLPAGTVQVEFKPIPGFTAPPTRPVTMAPPQDATITGAYTPTSITDPVRFTQIEAVGGILRLRARRATPGPVAVETSADLRTWSPLRTVTLGANVDTEFDVVLPPGPAGFLRLKNP